MSLVTREIEFEFQNDGRGSGQFLATGNVVTTLRNYMAQGKANEAARLFSSCTQNVGDEIIKDLRAGASQESLLRFAEMFWLARDYQRAAWCAEEAQNFDLAAQSYAANYNLEKAAACYLKANKHEKAAEVLEKSADFARAGDLYYRVKNLPKAAENWERSGSYLNAAKLYLQLSHWDKAAQVLLLIKDDDAHFTSANWFLGNIYERSGNTDSAINHYLRAIGTKPVDNETVEVYYRLAVLCESRGMLNHAADYLQRLVTYQPSLRDVGERFARLKKKVGDVIQVTAPAPQATTDRLIGIDNDFEYLRTLGLFSELSLEELKIIHNASEKITVSPNGVIIQQGTAGVGLFVIAEGKVSVRTRNADKIVELGQLETGAHVGEMSLLDDAPTSAEVLALTQVRLLKVSRERLQNILVTNDRIALRFYRTFVKELTQRLRRTNMRLTDKS